MGTPCITHSPNAVLVAVENSDLAIDTRSNASVSVGIEIDGSDVVFVSMIEVELEAWLLLGRKVRRSRWSKGRAVAESIVWSGGLDRRRVSLHSGL